MAYGKLFAAAAAIPALAFAVPAAAAGDSESYEIALSGEVESVCDITPEGSGSYDVDMTDFGNQGFLLIAFSCNSPYIVTLESANGGMKHSVAPINITYDVEGTFGGFQTLNSANIQNNPTAIVTETSWSNILTNGGLRSGNLDLVFPGLANSAVAGEYSDTLTIAVTAQL